MKGLAAYSWISGFFLVEGPLKPGCAAPALKEVSLRRLSQTNPSAIEPIAPAADAESRLKFGLG